MSIFGNGTTDNRLDLWESLLIMYGLFWDSFNVKYNNKPSKLSQGFSILESNFPDCLTHS